MRDKINKLTAEEKLIERQKFDSELGKNPFITPTFKIEVVNRTDNSTLKYDGDILVPVEIEMERGDITKLYTDAAKRLDVSKLSAAAQRLYLWIAYELDWGHDYIIMPRKRFMLENGISSINTYKKAVADLVTAAIVNFSVKKDVLWINPSYFFSGSRVDKYKDSVVEYKPKKKETR